ncbi:unnamed protein product [Cuscuta epithymum]|uniref:RING-type E3 ubiquitin transferase n=1 Tax=Cuscuta epithymum TaxID=186058 RepID=A0AAV0CGX5_9ASTE|nr:unnamed protein product [Cuscuta epithymum]
MRLLPEEATEYSAGIRGSPVAPSTASPQCVPRSRCPWWPYSTSRDFETNASLIIVVLFLALIFALGFSAAVRCVLRRRRRRHSASLSLSGRGNAGKETKAAGDEEEGEVSFPTVIFSSAAEGGGASPEECTICLSEFVEGERLRVLEKCKHCFHIECIQKWLKTHSSCPTCRASYE